MTESPGPQEPRPAVPDSEPAAVRRRLVALPRSRPPPTHRRLVLLSRSRPQSPIVAADPPGAQRPVSPTAEQQLLGPAAGQPPFEPAGEQSPSGPVGERGRSEVAVEEGLPGAAPEGRSTVALAAGRPAGRLDDEADAVERTFALPDEDEPNRATIALVDDPATTGHRGGIRPTVALPGGEERRRPAMLPGEGALPEQRSVRPHAAVVGSAVVLVTLCCGGFAAVAGYLTGGDPERPSAATTSASSGAAVRGGAAASGPAATPRASRRPSSAPPSPSASPSSSPSPSPEASWSFDPLPSGPALQEGVEVGGFCAPRGALGRTVEGLFVLCEPGYEEVERWQPAGPTAYDRAVSGPG